MRALVTGASSGIGKDICRELSKEGYDLVIVARNVEKLEELKKELKEVEVTIIPTDLSIKEECYNLYEKTKDMDIDLLVNNAGFGVFGNFYETDLERELEMISVNDIAPHILTKLFLKDFVKKNKGQILNVCSSASFYIGPMMATYYASKNYLYCLSMSIHEELRRQKSKVKISVLCPGPVDTNFNEVAKVKFAVKPFTSKKVASIVIKGLRKNKTIIIPGFKMRCLKFFSRFISEKRISKIIYTTQIKKS